MYLVELAGVPPLVARMPGVPAEVTLPAVMVAEVAAEMAVVAAEVAVVAAEVTLYITITTTIIRLQATTIPSILHLRHVLNSRLR